MAVPTPAELMVPILKFSKDGEEKNIQETLEYLKKELELTEEDLNVKTPHGHLLIENNIKQSRKFLVQSGLLEYTNKEYARITINGLKMANNS